MNLKEVRQFLGLTQKEFAETLKMSQSAISSIEMGRRNVTDRLINQVAVTFNLSEEALKQNKVIRECDKELQKDKFLQEFEEAYNNMTSEEREKIRRFMYDFGVLKKDSETTKKEEII